MAQGFIQPKGSTSKQMEDIGREYLADLVSRSLLNYSQTYSTYTMHDLTHDLACSVLGTDFWKIGDEKSHGNNAEKARYMSHGYITSCSNYEDFYCLKSLRNLSLSYNEKIPVPADLFINLRHIRTLLLSRDHITELPESVGDLLQLRYLDLSRTDIERLPKSTTRLYNLQTLLLDGCPNLVELPSDLSNLVNLRHLTCYELQQVSIPPRIGTLKGLQTLGYFQVGKEIGRGMNELKDLIHLRGFLSISELENVVNVEEAKDAQLKNKQKIDHLELRWNCVGLELRQEGIEEEVLNALQPHTNLDGLEIEGYCGVRFPTWLGDSSFSNLTEVWLSKCRCRLLPPFGRLPSLKYLKLEDLYELKKFGPEFYGDGTMTGFPPLESLIIEYMPDLEDLSGLESDIRPIRAIHINNCTKLRGLPRVSTIHELTLCDCGEQILTSLPNLTCLSSLAIHDFPNITSLPNGLQHLTSLQNLRIYNCLELTSLYDVDLPATLDDGLGNSNYSNPTFLPKGLQKLTLGDCPKIPSLPEELLTTLQSLIIVNCPLLVEKYLVLAEGGNGYRCKISDIPDITFVGYYYKEEKMMRNRFSSTIMRWLGDCADRSLNWVTADASQSTSIGSDHHQQLQ